jgi:hypothetical protein
MLHSSSDSMTLRLFLGLAVDVCGVFGQNVLVRGTSCHDCLNTHRRSFLRAFRRRANLA